MKKAAGTLMYATALGGELILKLGRRVSRLLQLLQHDALEPACVMLKEALHRILVQPPDGPITTH